MSPATQARYLSKALYLADRAGVTLVAWNGLQDRVSYLPGFPSIASGLFFNVNNDLARDPAKPARRAFRFPFVVTGRRAWGVAPRGGAMVRIEKRRGDGWRRVSSARPSPSGEFTADVRGRGVYRATSGWRPQPGLDALAPMHPRLRLIALALLLLAAFAPPADARYSSKKAIWGPTKVNGVSQFPIYRDLGVGIYQMQVQWNQVAPTRPTHPGDPADPAYRWPKEVDFAIRAGARSRIRVSVMLRGAPAWANGGRSSEWAPTHARDFGTFARAAARRYPGVHLWQIWGEPSRQNNFKPLPRFEATGPRRYARILDAAYGSLKRESRRNLVIGGNTFTTGDVSPRQFIRSMRLPNGRPPRMDLYGHNPIHAPKARASTGPAGSRLRGFLRPRHPRRVG